MLPTYGLTGGIASGKSQALAYFAALGIPTCDTDQLARDVVAPGTDGQQALEALLGSHYFVNQILDRRRLRDALFRDPALKRAVEQIIHPRVRHAVVEWRQQPKVAPYQIVCSPLLLETAHSPVDGIIVVDLDPDLQMTRGAARDGSSVELISRIMAAQIDRETRLKSADYVLRNSGSLEDLQREVEALHRQLKETP